MADTAYTVTLARDFQDLIPAFVENRRKELESLRSALAAGRYDQVRRLGHRMKGVGMSYGFDRVSILGGLIEDGAAATNRDVLEARIAEYADYLARVRVVYE